jgi:hypothetical protein
LSQYLIESEHAAKECLRALESIPQYSFANFKFEMACADGESVHKGWTIIQAENKTRARSMLPKCLQANAKIVRIKEERFEKSIAPSNKGAGKKQTDKEQVEVRYRMPLEKNTSTFTNLIKLYNVGRHMSF